MLFETGTTKEFCSLSAPWPPQLEQLHREEPCEKARAYTAYHTFPAEKKDPIHKYPHPSLLLPEQSALHQKIAPGVFPHGESRLHLHAIPPAIPPALFQQIGLNCTVPLFAPASTEMRTASSGSSSFSVRALTNMQAQINPHPAFATEGYGSRGAVPCSSEVGYKICS